MFRKLIKIVTALNSRIVIHAVGRIQLHYVPKDRCAADLDHGLGFEMGLFGNSGSKSPSQDDGFHIVLKDLHVIWRDNAKRTTTESAIMWV